MTGFEIGIFGERYRNAVRLTIEDAGIGLSIDGGDYGFGGHTTLSPEQCREIAGLLGRAADNWDSLSATKVQIEREESDLVDRKKSLVMRALFGSKP